ncbi:FkbM family methyltransferase [Phaeobacter sp. B1627]|uniref:FkbM family methyltransferase n=1 Tax=Phaeobacter sp. B1627 TaxID=2583809 RepID=UPI001119D2A4|nr:FkbM family methyltransferase [Phaeobacter sp. B1627]TNJ41983.1 FkbM family methyltransferase [Phaeobacter sp. B1627]
MDEDDHSAEATITRLRNRLQRVRGRLEKETRRAESVGFLQGVVATLRPGDLVLDCGANVGRVTTLLAESGADVVAFEPDPWAFERLVEATAHFDNVTCVNAAVGAEAATLTLYRTARFAQDPAKQSESSSIMPDARTVDAEGEGIEVEVIDFPAWLQARLDEGRRVALVKMDIEGAELDLMEVLLDRRIPDRTGPFLVETHPGLFPGKRSRFEALAQRAAEYPAKRVNLDWI